ncbi:SDR family oxidoreductase [Nonomuraea sp. NPDC049714]|uniref:SDR family oxidoreductase n=1 Tax=Nonomuraea sp. NPDC049714 TaxID=3364357 RepID=UPI00379949BB
MANTTVRPSAVRARTQHPGSVPARRRIGARHGRTWARVHRHHHRVRINGVSPGPVRTAGTTAMLGDDVETLGRGNLRERIGEPEEIASVVRFLIDAESGYINGTVIVVNGGEPSSLPK